MRHKLYKLMWEAFGYPDVPPKLKHFNPVKRNQYTSEMHIPTYNKVYELYLSGISIDDLATEYNVSRTRIRAYLWKAYNESIRNI